MLAGGGGRLLLRDQHRQRHDHRYSEEQGAARPAARRRHQRDDGRRPDRYRGGARRTLGVRAERLAGDLGVNAVAPDGATHRHCHGPRAACLRRIERHGGHRRHLNLVPQESHNRPGGHCRPVRPRLPPSPLGGRTRAARSRGARRDCPPGLRRPGKGRRRVQRYLRRALYRLGDPARGRSLPLCR
jgi:hypothetical protein